MSFGGGKKTATAGSGGRSGFAFGEGSKAVPAAGPANPTPAKVTVAVASVFGGSSDEEEEMPASAKARMRNVGKFTLTSAGPNSYSKGKGGFVDPKAKKWADDMSAKNGRLQRKPQSED